MSAIRALWTDWRSAADLDVVGLGECSLDQVCVVAELPVGGEKRSLLHYTAQPGGQVASAMLGCARLGLRAGYIGVVGLDPAAASVLAPLGRAGVELSGVRRVVGANTRTAVVLVRARDGERTVLAHRDPRLHLVTAQLEVSEIRRARVLQVDGSDPDASLWAARTAREAGIPVVLDADTLTPETERLLAVIDFPVVSREMAEELGGTGSPVDGLAKLAGWGARLAVVTCGSEGALARSGEQMLRSPCFDVDVQDTTGAGDAFHAGFIWGLLQGYGAERVLRVANAVAGLACTRLGAQAGLPRREEMLALVDRDEASSGARGSSGAAASPGREERRDEISGSKQ
ncbi:MAG: carbohydrate kinase family protein [Deltaproteobacteria bacterium]|nr:carbohydrate kinase family protein [Deltaproteobacteria bacterium]MBW2697654.1 carbohydrate kinase family protein [Deltaproteobacteria bacterium]